MSLPLILLLVGILFLVVFQGMSVLRREGLSAQLAWETLALTLVVAGVAWLTGFALNPVVFLILIYLVGMRTRLLVDIGNLMARQGRFDQAERFYVWASRLWPDKTGRIVIALNRGTCLIFQRKLDEAISAFRAILEQVRPLPMVEKYQAAAHYNLGASYRKQGNELLAQMEFKAVIDALPISEYGRMARIALKKDKPQAAPPE